MNNLVLLPYEIIDEILQYLIVCEVCNKYKLKKESYTCSICKRSWCHKCNNQNKFIKWVYLESYLTMCHYCYKELRSASFIHNLILYK